MTQDFEKEIRFGIAKKGGQKQIALEMGISESELSRKINGDRGWRMEELKKFFELIELKVSHEESKDDEILIKLLSKKLSEVME